jgi:hypothetical protein
MLVVERDSGSTTRSRRRIFWPSPASTPSKFRPFLGEGCNFCLTEPEPLFQNERGNDDERAVEIAVPHASIDLDKELASVPAMYWRFNRPRRVQIVNKRPRLAEPFQ